MDSFISTFHIDWKIIIAQAINFAVVVFVLYRFAIKPLTKNLDERKGTIEQSFADAKENAELLQNSKAEYDRVLASARVEAEALMKSAKADADKKRKALLETAKDEVAAMVESTKKELQNEKAKILTDARRQIADLVVDATGKVLGGTITPKINEQLLADALGK